jgi:non-ribosomal peptide synthetase component E (peptide arylation enzyme)
LAPQARRDAQPRERAAIIVRAPEPPLAIPEVALTPFLFERAAARGDKPAFVDGPSGRTLTSRGWAEAVLLAHPAVADAAVVPLPHEEAGEVPKAFVVLKGEAAPEQIMAFVAERVAPYKKLRCLEVIDQIPKSPSGKILRRVLVQR